MTRQAIAEDAARIAELNAILGRGDGEAQINAALERIRSNDGEAVLVSEDPAGRIQGWIHVGVREVLGSGRRCEIIGLVVDPNARGNGIGRRLVEAAETWGRERGLERVLVRSNVNRDGAHLFYPRLGYELVKTQHVYGKRGSADGKR